MHILKQSTAASVLVGPVLDSSNAPYIGAAIADFNITKNGTSAAMAAPATATHDHNGHYIIALATGNTDTLGRLAVSCNKATYKMDQSKFEVLSGATFDAIVTNAASTSGGLVRSGDVVPANTTQFAGVTTYAYDGVLASATSTTITFPSTDVAGNTVPDDGRYANSQLGIVGGTGSGQEIALGSRATNPRQYNVVQGTMPVTCDATSQYVLRGSTIVALDMTQAFPSSNTAGTVGDALNAARAQGFGRWTWPTGSTTITLYGADGTTIVKTLTVDSATAPRNRT